jgi:fucose 4-O-acetylase-like acetyltransferase
VSLRLGSAAAAGVLYFAMVFALGFIFGTARVLWVAPRVGELPAVLVELPLMLAAAWFICGALLRRFDLAGARERLIMGALAFVLLMLAELLLDLIAFGRSPVEHFADYRKAPDALGLAAQALFAIFPVLRLRGGRAPGRAGR